MGAIIAPIILNPRYRDGRARLICTSTSTSIAAALCLAIAAIASAMRPRPWVCPDGDVDGAFAGYQAQLATMWACLDDGAAEFDAVERGECGLLAWGQRLRVVKGELVKEGVIVVYGDALGFLHAESHDQPTAERHGDGSNVEGERISTGDMRCARRYFTYAIIQSVILVGHPRVVANIVQRFQDLGDVANI